MSSVSSSYQPDPDQWRWELRNFFLLYLVREESFELLIQKLTPYWNAVLESSPDLDPMTAYPDLPLPGAHGEIDLDSPLLRYLFLLQTGVYEDLRCRAGGDPAPWVCFAVHASINDTPLDMGVSPVHWTWIGELLIPILSSGSASVGRRINGISFSDIQEVQTASIEQPYAGTPFNQWKKLKKQAHQELDRLLEDLRGQVESKTNDWPRMYSKGRATRTRETMQKLVRWLVGREEQFAGDRTATNALLHELDLDPPVLSKKSDEK